MFAISDDDIAAIRAAFYVGGELAAAVEFRRRFRGITDNDVARDWVPRIVAWPPLAAPAAPPDCPRARREAHRHEGAHVERRVRRGPAA